MKTKQDDWMEKLVETYKVPVTPNKGKRILTERQIEIIKKRNS